MVLGMEGFNKGLFHGWLDKRACQPEGCLAAEVLVRFILGTQYVCSVVFWAVLEGFFVQSLKAF